MSPLEVEESIKKIIAEVMRAPLETLSPETIFTTDLDADSVAMVDMFMAIEDTFGINIVDKYNEDIKTVGDATQFVISQLPK